MIIYVVAVFLYLLGVFSGVIVMSVLAIGKKADAEMDHINKENNSSH